MKGRVVPGVLLALFWLLLLLYGSAALFFFVIVVVLFVAADEYVRMVRHNMLEDRLPLVGSNMLLPTLSAVISPQLSVVGLFSLVGFFLLSWRHVRRFAADDAEAGYLLYIKDVFGLFYIGFLGAHICLLRVLPEGAAWILVATAITAGSDTGAYFSGRRFGRHKLCPAVSPKKTIEGAVGGICCAIIAALLMGYWLLAEPQPLFLIALAVSLSLLGVMGDLIESVIKRGEGVKDSGSCLGGHGGILDRIDSLLFVAPALFYILLFSGAV